MANDKVSEVYYGRAMTADTQRICRERVDWMCAQVSSGRVLDLGCSQGVASILLAQRGCDVVGVDVDPEVIRYAEEDLARQPADIQSRVEFQVVRSGPLPFEEDAFDAVLLGEIMEHLVDPGEVLAEAKRVVRPNGLIIITTPFGLHPHPEHVQTFYLSNFAATVEQHLAIRSLAVNSKYIRCTAQPTGLPTPLNERIDLLAMSEAAFAEVEANTHRKLQDLRARAARRTSAVAGLDDDDVQSELKWLLTEAVGLLVQQPDERQLSVAVGELRACVDGPADLTVDKLVGVCVRVLETYQQVESRQHREEVRRLTTQVNAAAKAKQIAEAAAAKNQHRLAHQQRQIGYLQEELDRRLGEVRYRLGDALVNACTHPADLFRLPGRMLSLLLDGLKRRAERRRRGEQSASPLKPTTRVSDRAAVQPSEVELQTHTPQIVARPVQPPIRIEPVGRASREPRRTITAAAIMDEFSYEAFRDECTLLRVRPDNWEQVLTEQRPDFLFIESAWKGNDFAWRKYVESAHDAPDDSLFRLIDWCKGRDIPTVFWNKEDPPNFDHFIDAAATFDFVFTTDADCIPRYIERVGHDRVFALPFAAQPAIHNPIHSRRPRPGDVCFAGTWYNHKHDDRREDLEQLLKPAMTRGLHIYDRMHGFTGNDSYRFPDEFQPAIYGGLSYPEMLDAYKKYRVFLNVNSVKHSPTMLSRRVLELLACGTTVISNYSLAIERLLGRDSVALIRSEAETADWLDQLLSDDRKREAMVREGQRRVFAEHLVEHRLAHILKTIGLAEAGTRDEGVSAVSVVSSMGEATSALESFAHQTYGKKELLLAVNSEEQVFNQIASSVGRRSNVRAIRCERGADKARSFAEALVNATGGYIAIFDSADEYGANYLTDALAAFAYTDASLVGKACHVVRLPGGDTDYLRGEGDEHTYVENLPWNSLVGRRAVFDQSRQALGIEGLDHFAARCAKNGCRLYSTDRFEYVSHVVAGARHGQPATTRAHASVVQDSATQATADVHRVSVT